MVALILCFYLVVVNLRRGEGTGDAQIISMVWGKVQTPLAWILMEGGGVRSINVSLLSDFTTTFL